MLHSLRSRLVAGAVATAAAGAAVLATQGGTAAAQEGMPDAGATVVVTVKEVQSFRTDIDVKGDSVGDRRTFSHDVLIAGKKVGKGGGDCADVFYKASLPVSGRLWAVCTEILKLPAGQIVAQALVVSAKPAAPIVFAVTGGTGSYLGARGSLTMSSDGTKMTVKLL